VDFAGLESAFDAEQRKDELLVDNWQTVKDCKEDSPYQSRGQKEAEAIVAAINDDQHRVLQ
jgi:hypothetical protein